MAAPIPDVPASEPGSSTVTVAADAAASVSVQVAPPPDDGDDDQSWVGKLFDKRDMSVDSMIVIMALSIVCFWVCCGVQIWEQHETSSPMSLGGGFAAMMAVFAGGKTLRDRYSPDRAPQPPGG